MVVAGHDAFEPGVPAVVLDNLVAGRHIGIGKDAAHGRAKGHMPHHGRAVDEGQRFAGVAARPHAGGNDGNDVHVCSFARAG